MAAENEKLSDEVRQMKEANKKLCMASSSEVSVINTSLP